LLQGENVRKITYISALVALLIITLLLLRVTFQEGTPQTTQQSQVTQQVDDGANSWRPPSVGSMAPDGELILINGTVRSISYFRGKPLLLWFVATWCPSCLDGVRALNNSIDLLARYNVTIVVVQLYQNLGYPGPDITQFIRRAGGDYAYKHGYMIPAVSTYELTATYDPWGYPDIYYLIDSNGKVIYINGAPSLTLDQLLKAIMGSSQ